MAITFVTGSTGTDTSTTDTSKSFAFSVSAGDCIVVVLGTGSTATALGSVTDDGGNTYTQSVYYNTSAPYVAVYTCIATASAANITCNWTAGAKHGVVFLKYSGVGSIGTNTGTNHNNSSKNELVDATLASSSNWAVAGFVHFQGGGAPTQVSGNLRETVQLTSGQYTDANDNTGATSLSLANSMGTATTWSSAYVELVPAGSGSTYSVSAAMSFTNAVSEAGNLQIGSSSSLSFVNGISDAVLLISSPSASISITTGISDSSKLTALAAVTLALANALQAALPLTVYDDFNRANGSITSPWLPYVGFDMGEVISDAWGVPDTGNHGAVRSEDFANDQFAQTTFLHQSTVTTGQFLYVREQQDGTGDCYYVVAASGQTHYGLKKSLHVGGTTVLGTGTASITSGDVVRITAKGTTITVYVNGVQDIQVTDTSLSSGTVGILLIGGTASTQYFDNFIAGNLPAIIDGDGSISASFSMLVASVAHALSSISLPTHLTAAAVGKLTASAAAHVSAALGLILQSRLTVHASASVFTSTELQAIGGVAYAQAISLGLSTDLATAASRLTTAAISLAANWNLSSQGIDEALLPAALVATAISIVQQLVASSVSSNQQLTANGAEVAQQITALSIEDVMQIIVSNIQVSE